MLRTHITLIRHCFHLAHDLELNPICYTLRFYYHFIATRLFYSHPY